MPGSDEGSRGLHEDDVIEAYESGESARRIAIRLREQGVQATTESVEEVLNRHRIIRHATPGEVPKGAPHGFSATKPMRACAEGTGEELAAELAYRYHDQRQSLDEILRHLDLRHGVILSHSRLFEVLKSKGAVLRSEWKPKPVQMRFAPEIVMSQATSGTLDGGVALKEGASAAEKAGRQDHAWRILRASRVTYAGEPSKSDLCRKVILGRESELASRILAGESVKEIAAELEVDHIRLSTELKVGGHLPDVNLGRFLKLKRQQKEKKS